MFIRLRVSGYRGLSLKRTLTNYGGRVQVLGVTRFMGF